MKKQEIDEAMQSVVYFRGTKDDIKKKIAVFKLAKKEDILLTPFTEPLPENDLGFNINIGNLNGVYLDYEIYMLPTNKTDTFIVTEINSF